MSLIDRIVKEGKEGFRDNPKYFEELRKLKETRPEEYLAIRSAMKRIEEDEQLIRMNYQLEDLAKTDDLSDYIYLPGNADVGFCSYPGLLVAKKLTHFGNWYQVQEQLHEENKIMLTLRQWVDFIRLLKAGNVCNGYGELINKKESDKLLGEMIGKKNSRDQEEWFDVMFAKTKGRLGINYNHRTQEGSFCATKTERLEYNILPYTKGKKLDFFGPVTRQGFPKRTSLRGVENRVSSVSYGDVLWIREGSVYIQIYSTSPTVICSSDSGVRAAMEIKYG